MKIKASYFILPLALSALTKNIALAQTISIETNKNALVLLADKKHDLNTVYFGPKLADSKEYANIDAVYGKDKDYSGQMASAYTPAGSRNLLEPAIQVIHADGNYSLDLQYVSSKVEHISDDITLTSIVLKDPAYNFEVTLFYKAYFKDDVIEQWSNIRHSEKGEVTLVKFASANLYLKAPAFWLTQYHGDWAKEMRPEETQITHGIKTLDTKLGTRANLFQPSVFMVSLDKPATEDDGTVMYGGLEWSGNFRTDLELDPENNLRIISGINNYASPYQLKPNEDFVTPAFWYTLSRNGKGEASRNVQHWARNYKILDGKGSRLTLLNNWESTFFDFDETKLAALLKDTKKLGVDLFLLDDGWFGNKYPRSGDHTALGDWEETKTKLPNGIASLVKGAQDNGVKFGIWIEPEMVSPKSELYEKHPDWVIKQPKRDEYYYRNQLVLDLSNPAVQDFVYGIVDNLFTKNPALAYIKWDCNAVIYNAYSTHLKNQSQFYVDYVRGLYKVLERIRAKYPKVPMMLCSGGGGRVDYAALKYFTEFWPSDNTDPLERVFIQWEYSYFYPALSSSNHVTNWSKLPIKFRTDVAMMGKLGFDIVISKLGESDMQFVQGAVKTFNDIKAVVWQGDQYRLLNPRENSVASMAYVNEAKTTAIMFNYLVNYRYGEGNAAPIRLKGLDVGKQYKVKEINLYPDTKSGINESKTYTGDFLMKIGINPKVNLGRTSVILQIDAQ